MQWTIDQRARRARVFRRFAGTDPIGGNRSAGDRWSVVAPLYPQRSGRRLSRHGVLWRLDPAARPIGEGGRTSDSLIEIGKVYARPKGPKKMAIRNCADGPHSIRRDDNCLVLRSRSSDIADRTGVVHVCTKGPKRAPVYKSDFRLRPIRWSGRNWLRDRDIGPGDQEQGGQVPAGTASS